MTGLLAVEDARRRLVDALGPVGTETIGIADAAGRVLAAPVRAARHQPPCDASAMDGYAVRTADLAAGQSSFRLVGSAPAGRPFGHSVGPGETVRVFTGSVIPPGADRVIVQELATRDGDTVSFDARADGPDHVRRAGVDFREGEALLEPGRRLDFAGLALLAAANAGQAIVYRRPRIEIFASGDELKAPGSELGPADIVDSASYGLLGLVAECGGRPLLRGVLPDDLERCEQALATAGEDRPDLLVVIGGASVGDHDVLRPAAKRLGAEMLFAGLDLKPGKPTWAARLGDGVPLLGVPGNPASSLVVARLFLAPALYALTGRPPASAVTTVPAQLAADLPAGGRRETWLRGNMRMGDDGTLLAEAADRQDSSLLTPLAAGNVLIRRASSAPAAVSGDTVEVLPLSP